MDDPRRKLERKAPMIWQMPGSPRMPSSKKSHLPAFGLCDYICILICLVHDVLLFVDFLTPSEIKVERCSDGTGWKLAFPERLLKSSTANVTKIEMAAWQREGLMMFDGFESSAAFVQKFAQSLVLLYLGEVTNQDIGWLVSDNLATLDQVTPSSTVELCEVFMGSGMKWHEFNRTHTCVM